MARIRTIKPELLDDEVAAELSDAAWRLFVSSWLLADDHGRFRAGRKFLAAHVWQDTSRDADSPLRELAAKGRVLVWHQDGQRYALIVNWRRHQRIDNASKPRIPEPPTNVRAFSRQFSESLREPPTSSDDIRETPLDPDPDPDPDQDRLSDSPPQPDPQNETTELIWNHYLALRAERGMARNPKLTPARRAKISKRLENFSADELCNAVSVLLAENSWHVRERRTAAEYFMRSDDQVDKLLEQYDPDEHGAGVAGNGKPAGYDEALAEKRRQLAAEVDPEELERLQRAAQESPDSLLERLTEGVGR